MIMENEFIEKDHWGLTTCVNAYNCNPLLIRSIDMIKLFVSELCHKIEMKRFGECQVVHFGREKKVEGYSFNQFIETSSIIGHFAEEKNNAYIDVFSCKYYEPSKVSIFVKEFFEAEKIKINVIYRESKDV